MHWPDPAQRPRIAEIRDNLHARIAEAEREGWLGEVEGLKVSLAGAETSSPRSTRPYGVKPPRSSSACPHSPASPQTAPPRPADQQTGQQGTNTSVQRTSGYEQVNTPRGCGPSLIAAAAVAAAWLHQLTGLISGRRTRWKGTAPAAARR